MHTIIRMALLTTLLFTAAATKADESPLPAMMTPYLQNPTADNMTVCVLAQQDVQDVRVLWHRDGDAEKPTVTKAKGTPIPGTPWAIWKARLTPLQAIAAYEYHIRYVRDKTEMITSTFRFHAMDRHAKTFRRLSSTTSTTTRRRWKR